MSVAMAEPALWSVPREWVGERCFILCTGESIKAQLPMIPQLKGRFIAVKHAVFAKPDADVLFLAGEMQIEAPLLKHFTGSYVVTRRIKRSPHPIPEYIKRVTRTKDHEHLCDLRDHVCGYDCGTSSIDLAYKFGAIEIVLLGYDMTGGHAWPHPLQNPPAHQFRGHMKPLAALAKDAERKGIRIVNCSPISKVTAFEKQPLEAFL